MNGAKNDLKSNENDCFIRHLAWKDTFVKYETDPHYCYEKWTT